MSEAELPLRDKLFYFIIFFLFSSLFFTGFSREKAKFSLIFSTFHGSQEKFLRACYSFQIFVAFLLTTASKVFVLWLITTRRFSFKKYFPLSRAFLNAIQFAGKYTLEKYFHRFAKQRPIFTESQQKLKIPLEMCFFFVSKCFYGFPLRKIVVWERKSFCWKTCFRITSNEFHVHVDVTWRGWKMWWFMNVKCDFLIKKNNCKVN